MPDECVFCRIIRGDEPATVVHRWADAMAIVPLNPVTPGHLLVIPIQHTRDITEDAWVSATAMRRAAEVAQAPCNIITSAGPEATQSVPHLHIHVVPRVAGDGLALPWTGQAERGRLLPDGGLTRTEWAVTTPRGKQIHYVYDEVEARTCAIYGPRRIPVSRQVTNWPDGTMLTTRWVPVPDNTKTETE